LDLEAFLIIDPRREFRSTFTSSCAEGPTTRVKPNHVDPPEKTRHACPYRDTLIKIYRRCIFRDGWDDKDIQLKRQNKIYFQTKGPDMKR